VTDLIVCYVTLKMVKSLFSFASLRVYLIFFRVFKYLIVDRGPKLARNEQNCPQSPSNEQICLTQQNIDNSLTLIPYPHRISIDM